jgi:diphthine-ammonia ligase
MPSSLNVVALISGGKDSFYSILHCIQNGHSVIALANLYPPAAKEVGGSTYVSGNGHGEGDDLNSFMYQTVGHNVVPLYASALNLPLYRRRISGTATQTGRYYAHAPDGPLDETEDLVPLLQEVMQHHADVNAICSGAILSTYQRTRIESVAVRLGLTPLAFLWQYPALPPPIEREDSITGLLDDMAAAGCDSRIIKIASGGLRDSMLWANVTSPRTRNQLVAAMSPFFEDREFWLRGSVLGEGGEYETLAVTGPPRVWKQRIVIQEHANTVIQDGGGASHLRLGNARLEGQELNKEERESSLVRIPGLYDPAFATFKDEYSSVPASSAAPVQSTGAGMEDGGFSLLHQARLYVSGSPYLKMATSALPRSIVISNITTTECHGASHKTEHIMQLLQTCIHSINQALPASAQLSIDDIVFTSLLLESMSDFAGVNAEYGKLFRSPNPPARVTVACGRKLPGNVQVSLSAVLDTGPREKRRGLHVQSRSYWAPANIGPYSQAISVPFASSEGTKNGENGELVHVAGQIPLLPHTMEMMEGTFLHHTVLSLQHLWRVGQERGVDLWTHGVAFLADPSKSVEITPEILYTVWKTWKRAHAWSQKTDYVEGDDEDEEAGPDAWDLRHNPYYYRGLNMPDTTGARRSSGTHLHPLPRLSVMQTGIRSAASTGSTFTPPLLIAEVESLPRSAPIEWHSLGLGGMPTTNPRIRLCTVEARGILVSHCTVLANAPEQGGSDAGDVPEAKLLDASTTRSTDKDFVTVQVCSPEELPGSNRPDDSQSPTYLILSIVSTLSELVNTKAWTIAQGTAYVAGTTGWSTLQSLQQTPGWECLTIIPCHGVWGAATESRDYVRPLSLGLVLRLEALSA